MVHVALEYNGPVDDETREFKLNWDATVRNMRLTV